MSEYLNQFQKIQKRIQLREKASEEAWEGLEGDEKRNLQNGINFYNYRFFALRTFPIAVLGILLLTPVLQTKSRFFVKEISIILGISGGIIYGDYQNSEYFWDNYGKIIMENTTYNDVGFSQDQMQKMKKLYERSKNYKQENKTEKMYE
ncbi:hypothetical protein FGO68_gene17362 [Halteria grandinella]|uniref:Uncharacterized protein n=1 Tax=Halteria grandinella TaxID=5974 RepID=A0A8J8NFE4_HALGN|nr:hypothetical protein FGO68_gene17362 [Halteria grandinella]